MKKYGYVRVSTKEQNLDRQIAVMREEKVEEKIYTRNRYLVKILKDHNITN